jgi:acyl-coenzyme A synthetase/AMP-(fatty) acid ligase
VNLSAAVSAHAARRPSAPALLTPSRQITYAMLDDMVWRVATDLARRGVRAGDRVGITLADNVAHAVTMLALIRLGAAQYGLSLGDSASVREATIRRLGIGWTIGCKPPPGVEIPSIAIDPTLAAYAALTPDRSIMANDPDLPWLAMMSSGTTGSPKAFLLSHAQTLGRFNTYCAGIPLTAEDRFISLVELGFGSARQRTLYSFLSGGTVVMTENVAQPLTTGLIDASRASIVFATPFHLFMMLHHAGANQSGYLLPHVRMLVASTSEVGDELRHQVRQHLTPNLHVAYGSSEVGYVTAGGPEAQAAVPGSVGFPLPGPTLQLFTDGTVIHEPGTVGRIRVRAPFLIAGYLDDPEMTRRYFQDDWFYPGDLGEWSADGQLIFRGRADDMMMLDGINIYPAEIEQTLLRHPAVAEAAAFGIKSQIHQDIPCAAVVLREAATPEALAVFCRDRIGLRGPKFVMIMRALPRSAAGKILRNRLAEQCVQYLAQASSKTPNSTPG